MTIDTYSTEVNYEELENVLDTLDEYADMIQEYYANQCEGDGNYED